MRAAGLRIGPMVAVAAALSLAGCAHLVVLHDPLTASEHNDLGVAYESAGHEELAAREYRKALRLEPRRSQTWVNLGNLDAAKGRWPAAEKSYRHALRDSSTNADAMNNLAVALLRQRRHQEEARALGERALTVGGGRDSLYRATLVEVNRWERP